jgi:hypothetical protein
MVTTGGVVSVTVTVKLAFAALPCVSVAVQATVVKPRGKVLPDAGAQETVAASSGSIALTAYVTTAPVGPVASAVMLAGVVITGGVVSAGGPRPPTGGVVSLPVGSPQQTRVPPVWIAQLNPPPEETWLNAPVVGVASSWCNELSPQQASVPSVRSPQVCSTVTVLPPEETWL